MEKTASSKIENNDVDVNKKPRYNIVVDAVYNIITWLPSLIISYVVSSIDWE